MLLKRVNAMFPVYRLRAVAKRSLALLGSRPWFRPLGMALIDSLNRGTFRLLKATPGVHDVYARGSFARGSFVPLSSDVDLAIILTDAGGRSLDIVTAIHRSMQKVRRRNPSVRDWWHHLITESELRVVETFSDLYGSHEWLDANGRATAPCSDWVDERLRCAAAWSQLCLWSGSAFHAFLYPQDRVHNFEAGVIKTIRFASRLGVNGPSPPPTTRHTRLVEVYRAIEQGAARVLGGVTPAAAPAEGIIRTDRAMFVLLANGLSDAELIRCFDDLALRKLPAAAVTYVMPAAAFSAWPFPADEVVSGAIPPPMPLPLAREIYLFEALFLPSALRLALNFPDANQRLRRVISSLYRAYHLYAGTELPEPVVDCDIRAYFDNGSSLCKELQELLLAFSSHRRAG